MTVYGMRRLIGFAALAAAAGPARADGDRALSVGLSWATFSAPGKATNNQTPADVTPDWGGALSGTYEHAFSTDLSFRGELVAATFHGGQSDPKTQSVQSIAALADAGIVFRFDVLKYVPYAFGGIGGVAGTGGPMGSPSLIVSVGGGLDWLLDRGSSVGFELRLAGFASDTTFVTLGVRYSSRWGYF